MSKNNQGTLWSGAFEKSMHAAAEAFSVSVDYDKRLALFDIQGSIAHATMLAHCGIISNEDKMLIINSLQTIASMIKEGKFKWNHKHEDVHMNIESMLIKDIGQAGEKLHTARSRNDQIALDMRLYLRTEINEIIRLITLLQRGFLDLANCHKDSVFPGYTHLQQAQPVLFAHHMLAYIEMFERDRDRFLDCRKRMNVLPLGSCALAGTSLPIKREIVAELLGFDSVARNSMDAVSDRDFIIECAGCLALMGIHFSRWAEELVIWSTREFGFVSIGEDFLTGSSAMPQKKNPDIAELTRGKSGRLIGNLTALLTMMKGLPLTYNRDMQEDKEAIFDSVDTAKAILAVNVAMIATIEVNEKVLNNAFDDGYLLALDLAEYLVEKGIPFREAHAIVGNLVKHCTKKKKKLNNLSNNELVAVYKGFEGANKILSAHKSVERKTSYGSTGAKNVEEMIHHWTGRLLERGE